MHAVVSAGKEYSNNILKPADKFVGPLEQLTEGKNISATQFSLGRGARETSIFWFLVKSPLSDTFILKTLEDILVDNRF